MVATLVSHAGKQRNGAFKLMEDEETDQGYKSSKKHCKRQEDSGQNEKASDLETKLLPDETGRTKSKKKSKVTGSPAEEDEEETKKKSSKRKEKCEPKKQTRASKSSKHHTLTWITTDEFVRISFNCLCF